MNNFETLYNKLNTKQKEAVNHVYGPCLVIAGPGTGKTQIISLRIAKLLTEWICEPWNILVTTFTEAWVISLKKRLFDFIWTESYKINVCTIHSFCNEVIQTFPEKFLYYKASRAIDEIEQIELFENIIEEQKLEYLTSDYDKFYFLPAIRNAISRLKQEWISPAEFDFIISKQVQTYEEELAEIKPTLKKYEQTKEKQAKHIDKLKELKLVYKKYLETCRELEVYDFSDMINFVLEVLKTDTELQYYFAEKYQFIMVDEYQDTNNAQNKILESILSVSDDKNIMVVWDDDQSIYKFQWANLDNILYFSKNYENTNIIVLEENYRSTSEIIDVFEASIENNKARIVNFSDSIKKKFNSNSTYSEKEVSYFITKTEQEEKASVFKKIVNLIESGLSPEDIAIITRTNREVEEWTDFLQKNSLKVESKIDTNILNSRYILFLLDLISIVEDAYIWEEKLINLLRHPIFWIEKIDVLKINRWLYNENYTRSRKLKIFDILSNKDFMESLELANLEKINEFRNLILLLQEIQSTNNFYFFFRELIEKVWLLDYLEQNASFEELENLFTLSNLIKWYTENDRNFSIAKFNKKISYHFKYNIAIKRNVIKWESSWVKVLTAHQSKWLEYDSVFVVWLCDGNWWWKKKRELIILPALWSVDYFESKEDLEEDSTEEERRLFFVAVSRAKRNLYLSNSMSQWNKIKLKSLFLQELPLKENLIEDINHTDLIIDELKNEVYLWEDLSEQELKYIKEFLQNYKLSPSDLNKFIEDPKMFLRDAVFKYPFEDNEFTIFGKVYHKALEIFYWEYKKTWVKPEKKYLTNLFEVLLSKQILTPEQEEKLKEKWITWLEGWYDNYLSTMSLPLELEYNFYPKNVVFAWIPLTWKVDKIELIEDNIWTKKVRLVDYKTGKPKSENEVKWKTAKEDKKYLRQVLFYKILADNCPEFNAKYEIWEIYLEFVEWRDWKYTFVKIEVEKDELEQVKQDIIDTWNKINDLEFWREIIKK